IFAPECSIFAPECSIFAPEWFIVAPECRVRDFERGAAVPEYVKSAPTTGRFCPEYPGFVPKNGVWGWDGESGGENRAVVDITRRPPYAQGL
ncbi:MAG: hypothetical protein LBE17_05065, partial [Treponema sp.]|nr:hypothetical protein [Treponema sp.]